MVERKKRRIRMSKEQYKQEMETFRRRWFEFFAKNPYASQADFARAFGYYGMRVYRLRRDCGLSLKHVPVEFENRKDSPIHQ